MTLIILVAIIISSFAITTFAVEEEIMGEYVSWVTIQTMAIRGCAPQTESATFNTISETYSHKDNVFMGCGVCLSLDEYEHDMSLTYDLNPDGVYVDMYFPWDCWTNHKNGHGIVYYIVIME